MASSQAEQSVSVYFQTKDGEQTFESVEALMKHLEEVPNHEKWNLLHIAMMRHIIENEGRKVASKLLSSLSKRPYAIRKALRDPEDQQLQDEVRDRNQNHHAERGSHSRGKVFFHHGRGNIHFATPDAAASAIMSHVTRSEGRVWMGWQVSVMYTLIEEGYGALIAGTKYRLPNKVQDAAVNAGLSISSDGRIVAD